MVCRRLLTINAGSSSLKATLYRVGAVETPELVAEAQRIGLPGSRLCLTHARSKTLHHEQVRLPNHAAAVGALLDYLRNQRLDQDLSAIGHRIVQGGDRYAEPLLISAEVVSALRQLVQIDPDHMPQALGAIEAASRAYPALPQVACFDTAFHSRMPRVARLFALPRHLADNGVLRYGFHGLSYEYVMGELRRLYPEAAASRLIIAHLGNGASMAAVCNGIGVDTTMGFTPAGGLMMGTRPGDLDPGVLLHLIQKEKMTPDALNDLVNRRSGLMGLSETTSDMRDLLGREADDSRAAEAVALFCYQAKKFLGALTTALGGLDTLIFTGGIGEHAATVRWRICDGLEFLGLRLDRSRNAKHAAVVSGEDSPVTVRVIPTDENLMIAHHTRRLVWPTMEEGA
jgi:acetate kinase